jgi:hypothetical protein
METSSRVVSPQGGVARRRPTPPGGEEPPDSVSNPFSSRDFKYLIKTTKINRKTYHEPFLTRTVTYSEMDSAVSCICSLMNSSRVII